MGSWVKKYFLSLLIIGIALCSNVNIVAAGTAKSSEKTTSQADRLKELPHSAIEITSQPVTASGNTGLQKRFSVFYTAVVLLSADKASAKLEPTGRYSNRELRKIHLTLIYPFHHFW